MSSAPASLQPTAPRAALEGPPRAARWIPPIPPAAIVGVALLVAAVAGRLLADGRIALGMALVLAVCYAPLVFLNLPAAFALYVAVLFIQDIPAFEKGPNTIAVLVLVGWIGTIFTRSARPAALREQPGLLFVMALFGLWLALSVTWASDPSDARHAVQWWLLAILAFIITATTVRTPRTVKFIALAFIVGAVISVLYGIFSGALSAAVSAYNETVRSGRLTGGGGDPNVQAAGFLAAMFLCTGLWSVVRGRLAKLSLLLAFIVVAVGFFATQSRGGLIALGAALIAGMVLLRRHRKRLLGVVAAAGIGLGILALVHPSAVTRITDVGGGTSGRSSLWKVAWTIFSQHPWVGIGIGNFQAVESNYTLRSGSLTRVELIAQEPHLVHNVFLQLLTETGIVGFLLFLVLVVLILRASWRAARRFDALGRVDYGDLARAVLMGSIAMLSAQFFISDGEDWRMWILLALGPVLLSLANARASPRESPSRETVAAGAQEPLAATSST